MKIVLVKWRDAITFGHWADNDTVDSSKVKVCYAVGLLVTQNEEKITVALLSAEDKESFSNWINIPSECVTEVTEVGEVDWEVPND